MPAIVFILFMIGGLVLFFLSFKSGHCPEEKEKSLDFLTPAQRKLYLTLKRKGFPVALSQPCGRYTIEMALPHYRIAIECPSKVVPFPSYEDRAYTKKDLYLANRGWITLRFSASMIQHQSLQVIKRIEDKIYESQVP